jgi:hypothetical protein
MTANQRDRSAGTAKRRDSRMSTLEIARFLKRLSAFYRDPRTGNARLADALGELASALSTHSDLPLREALSSANFSAYVTPPQREMFSESGPLRDLSLERVEEILSGDEWSKMDLIRLGTERFAISRSRLERLSKAEVADAIRSALRNEESLKIISQQAERGGTNRSS